MPRANSHHSVATPAVTSKSGRSESCTIPTGLTQDARILATEAGATSNTPAPYRLGRHPRRPDHPALLNPDGTAAHTFHTEATRTEIAAILAARGLALHADGTVTEAPPKQPLAPITHTMLRPRGLRDPDLYGLVLDGDCMAPTIKHGETAMLSPAEPVKVGSIVAMWPADGGRPMLKRVVRLPMWPVGTPVHRDSEVVPAVEVEQLNPPKRYFIGTDKLKAMHAMVAVYRQEGESAGRCSMSTLAIVAYVQGVLEHINNTTSAVYVVAESAAKLLDDDNAIQASALRAVARAIGEDVGDLLDDVNQMIADPKWNPAAKGKALQ